MCTKYCDKSLDKQSLGVQEWINPFYIEFYGENYFSLWTFRVKDDPKIKSSLWTKILISKRENPKIECLAETTKY